MIAAWSGSVWPVRLWFGAFLFLGAFGSFFLHHNFTEARNMSSIRDTLSTSVPSAFSNHTIEFRVDTVIPPGGFITVTPEAGVFTIPTSATFSYQNVELYVAPPAGAYTLRPGTTTADAVNDGISITTGASGNVTFTLNSTTGIATSSSVRILLGDHTTLASTTLETGLQNPGTVGTRSVYVTAGGLESANARAMVAIVDQVGVGPLDTTETTPPIRFNGAPTGTLSGTVTGLDMSVETDELADCRYGTASGTPFFSMGLEFTTTGQLVHVQEFTGLATNTTYTYFVRCIDDEGNVNTDDYEITFTIPPPPQGSPAASSSTSTPSTGGSGTGTGSSGSGSGSSSGGGGGSGSGGSGSGGGNTGDDDTIDGGGGLEGSVNPYPSGDARVIISGYAFPGSTQTILVDGTQAKTTRANNVGQFTATLEAIARGVYTFGVYAVDSQGTRSTTFATTFSVAGGRTSSLSNIHIMPTIKVNPNPVEPNATVNFSGYAISNSVVEIENSREKSGAERRTFTTNADSNGKWSLDVSTDGFARDKWKVRAKSTNTTLGISTQYSNFTFYGVGQAVSNITSDLNRDGKVNLIDFSILLFHWNTTGGASDPPADINRDGRVSLTDFSIMVFNWTG